MASAPIVIDATVVSSWGAPEVVGVGGLMGSSSASLGLQPPVDLGATTTPSERAILRTRNAGAVPSQRSRPAPLGRVPARGCSVIGNQRTDRSSPAPGFSHVRLAAVVILMALAMAACGSSGSSAGGPGSSVIRTTTSIERTTTTRAPLVPTSRTTLTTSAPTTATSAATTTTTDATTTTSASTSTSSSSTTSAPTTTEATTTTTLVTTTTTPSTSTSAPTNTTAPASTSSNSSTAWWLIALAALLLLAAIGLLLLIRKRRHAAWLAEVHGLLSETADLRASTRAVVNAPGGHAVVELDRLASDASALQGRLARRPRTATRPSSRP